MASLDNSQIEERIPLARRLAKAFLRYSRAIANQFDEYEGEALLELVERARSYPDGVANVDGYLTVCINNRLKKKYVEDRKFPKSNCEVENL